MNSEELNKILESIIEIDTSREAAWIDFYNLMPIEYKTKFDKNPELIKSIKNIFFSGFESGILFASQYILNQKSSKIDPENSFNVQNN